MQIDRPENNDPFDGINTKWTRVEGGEKVGKLVDQALAAYDFKAPEKSVAVLVEIHQAIESLSPSVWKTRKLKAVKALIKSCAGLSLQLNSDRGYGIAGEELKISFNAVHQSQQDISIKKVGETKLAHALTNNTAYKKGIRYSISKGLGSPYWLLEKGSLGVFKIKDKNLIGQPETPALKLPIEVSINGSMIVFEEKIDQKSLRIADKTALQCLFFQTLTYCPLAQNGLGSLHKAAHLNQWGRWLQSRQNAKAH